MPYDRNNNGRRGGYDRNPQDGRPPRTSAPRRPVPPSRQDDDFRGRGSRGPARDYDRPAPRGGYGRSDTRGSFDRPAPRSGGFRPARPAFDRPAPRPAQPPVPPRPLPAPVPPRPLPAEPEMPENLLVGRNPIREAIKSGRDIEKLLVMKGELSGSAREIVARAHEARIVVQEVDKVRLDAIYPHHQGMLAFVSAAKYAALEDIFTTAEERDEEPLVVVLDGITDPHNLGAIIRSAECVGAHGVIIPERRSVGLTPAAVKAAAGACEYMNVVRVVNLTRTLEDLKERGLWIVGATMDGEDVSTANLTGPLALVIGAEGEGISQLVEKNCDMKVSLPMRGHIESLNASVAAGVMLYAVLNARRG